MLLAGGSGFATFVWSNGQNSTFSYTKTTVDINGQIIATLSGTITSGVFAGEFATKVVVLPTADLTACETGGLSDSNGAITLQIVPPSHR
jgi:hypothetical protein